jgi:hypothetical protein
VLGTVAGIRAGALERLSVTEARSRFGDQTFWNGVIAMDTSRKARAGALERLSVTEARSRFGDGRICSFNGESSDQNRPLLDGALTNVSAITQNDLSACDFLPVIHI